MDKLPASVKLQAKFDPAKLRRDLRALQGLPFFRQSGPYHNGKWKGLSLVSPGGRLDWDVYDRPFRKAKPTEILRITPYFSEVLKFFETKILGARLMRLEAGGRILPHRDPAITYEKGIVRLHVPIVTHSRVEFLIGGVRQRWSPGELWYGDFSLLHSVRNAGERARVHLMIDLELNAFVRQLFPPAFRAAAMFRSSNRASSPERSGNAPARQEKVRRSRAPRTRRRKG